MLNVPTIIAQTYTLSKRSENDKDYQYFTVEYSLKLLCAVGYAVLEEHSDVPPPKHNQDYSKMSMGLWLSLLRSLCSEMQKLSVNSVGASIQEIESLGILKSTAQFVTGAIMTCMAIRLDRRTSKLN